RGTWMGNPYKEDGAPQSGTNYPNNNNWGRVPRASTTTTTMGGYWIDQNSGNPTAGWTLSSSAGLCTLCHGTNVDSMDKKTGEGLWVGTNGHSNAVIGGSGSAKANIFDARGGTGGRTNNPYQHFNGFSDPADNGKYGFRTPNSRGWRYSPLLTDGASTRPRKYNSDEWGVDESGATTQTQYHKFSCSKCHNPHASRLPKLMQTNCLDTKHNTWDNGFQVNGSGGSNNNGRSISNWTSAQNCHRLGGNDPSDTRDSAGVGNGWNKVTPW
ncbi:cytochrome c3 family protein, partial [Geothermobacter hydrogeniphilus]